MQRQDFSLSALCSLSVERFTRHLQASLRKDLPDSTFAGRRTENSG